MARACEHERGMSSPGPGRDMAYSGLGLNGSQQHSSVNIRVARWPQTATRHVTIGWLRGRRSSCSW